MDVNFAGVPTSVLLHFACDCAERALKKSASPSSALKQGHEARARHAIACKRQWIEGTLPTPTLQQANQQVWEIARRVQTTLSLLHPQRTQLAARSQVWSSVGQLWATAYATQDGSIPPEEIASVTAYNAASITKDAPTERRWQTHHLEALCAAHEQQRQRLLSRLHTRLTFLNRTAPHWQKQLEDALF